MIATGQRPFRGQEKSLEQVVTMGQTAVARAPARLVATLGSCVAIVLFHPRYGLGALAHVVHPDSAGRKGPPGKFADTAVPYLLELLRNDGVEAAGLTARIAGGASLFAPAGPDQIGPNNLEAVRTALDRAGLRIIAEHTGEALERLITLDCRTGDLRIEVAGAPAALI